MLNITPVTNHREREKGVIIYPVYSRRSEGLSIGINLFTDKKSCAFDCPYCEVFPFSGGAEFSLEQMEDDLRAAAADAHKQNIPIKDFCFSGNGEPTLSPVFGGALKLAENIRLELSPSSQLVIITNGTGLSQPRVFSLLKEAAQNPAVDIWLKVDAGTADWYQKMNRPGGNLRFTDSAAIRALSFDKHIEKIKEFTSCSIVTIQTMLCAINEEPPPQKEALSWENFVLELAANAADNKAGGIRKIQIYGKARAAPEDPLASVLPDEYLEKRAGSLRNVFTQNGLSIPVEIYF